MKSMNTIINKQYYISHYFGLLLMACSSTFFVACNGGSVSGYSSSSAKPPVTPPPPPINSTPSTSPNANKMGINIAAPLDYEEDRLYADVIRTSRTFIAGASENGTTPANVDPDGWPQSDFSFYLWDKLPNMSGTYTLTFEGQASVTSSGGTIATSYDLATNTSTGTYVRPISTNSFALRFTNTKRTNSSTTGSGVTKIKFMRPLTPGSTTSYPSTTLFTDTIKTLISKFSVIRFMDFLATNANQQKTWSERPLPTWPSFNRYASGNSPTSVNKYGWQGIGGPLEHAILLANETGDDAWINIPILADDNYVTNVAKLLAYGSDGVDPYSSTQATPIYPPVNSNLHVYIEYSNEIWNSASAFTQFYDNCQMASDELANTIGASPLNWDGLWNNVAYVRGGTNTSWNWSMCWRRPAKRTVEISNIFRSVFGDAAMMTRVRPVMMTQLTSSGRMLFDETKMLLDYYNHMAGDFPGAPAAHPPSYYIYGAGGSGYYNVTTPSSLTTLDQVFSSPDMLPAGFTPELQTDAKYTAALGVKRVAYEGGPSFDNVNTTINAIYAQAVLDPRIKTTMIGMHNEWSANNGDLLVYYRATGDQQWGFTPDVTNLGTFKFAAIDALNVVDRNPLTFGTLFPGSLAGTAADTCSRNDFACSGNRNIASSGSGQPWASYTFRATAAAPWTVTLTISTPVTATVAVYVDGVPIDGTKTATGTLSFNAGTIDAGIHGVIVRAVTGSFTLSTVAVN